MKRKELTEKVMLVSNWKQPFGFLDLYKNSSALQGLNDEK